MPAGFDPVRDAAPSPRAPLRVPSSPRRGQSPTTASSSAFDNLHGDVAESYRQLAHGPHTRRGSASPPIPSPRSGMGLHHARTSQVEDEPRHYAPPPTSGGRRPDVATFDAVRDTMSSPVQQRSHIVQSLHHSDHVYAGPSSSSTVSPEMRSQTLQHPPHPLQAQHPTYLQHPMHPPPSIPQLARTSSNESRHSQGTRSSLGPAQAPTDSYAPRRPSRSASIADMLNDEGRGPLTRNPSGGSSSGAVENNKEASRQAGPSQSPVPFRQSLHSSPAERHALLPPHDVRRGGSASSTGSGVQSNAAYRAEQSPRSPALINLLNSSSTDDGRQYSANGGGSSRASMRQESSPSVLHANHTSHATIENAPPTTRFSSSMSPSHASVLQSAGVPITATHSSPSMSPGEARRQPPRLFPVDTGRGSVGSAVIAQHSAVLAHQRATPIGSAGAPVPVEHFAVPQVPRRSPESRRATLPAFAPSPKAATPHDYAPPPGALHAYQSFESPVDSYPHGYPPTPGAPQFPRGYMPTAGVMPRTPVTPGGVGPYGEYQPPPTPGGSSADGIGPAGYFYHSQPPGPPQVYHMSPGAAPSPARGGQAREPMSRRRLSVQDDRPLLYIPEDHEAIAHDMYANGVRSVEASPHAPDRRLPAAIRNDGMLGVGARLERGVERHAQSYAEQREDGGQKAGDPVAKRKRSNGSAHARAVSPTSTDTAALVPPGRMEDVSVLTTKTKKPRRASTRESTAGDIRGKAPVPKDEMAATEAGDSSAASVPEDMTTHFEPHQRRQSKSSKQASLASASAHLSPALEEEERKYARVTPAVGSAQDVEVNSPTSANSKERQFVSTYESPAEHRGSEFQGERRTARTDDELTNDQAELGLSGTRTELLPSSPAEEGGRMRLSEAASSTAEADSAATQATSVTSPSMVKPSSGESSHSDKHAGRQSQSGAKAPKPGHEPDVRSFDVGQQQASLPRGASTPVPPAPPSKPPRTRYQAKRVSVPGVVRVPLAKHELEQFRYRSSNPLRAAWQDEHRGRSDGWGEMFERFGAEADEHDIAGGAAAPPSHDARSGVAQQAPPLHNLPRKPESRGVGSTEASAVASHYNARPDAGLDARKDSPILPLRQFNNWVKSSIISRFGVRNGRVLDLGAGKGGDLRKWHAKHVREVVLVDIAAQSIEQARARYAERKQTYHAEFFAFDAFGSSVLEHIPARILEPLFDNVSLQFCMHYAWEKVPKVNLMLENVAKYLKPGGTFIGTIPDADRLRRDLKSLPGEELTFGNEFYRVSFDPSAPQKKHTCPAFGHKYTFWLRDAIDECDEYVVDFEQFESLASQMGLRLIYRKTFEEVWLEAGEQRESEAHRLLSAMRIAHPATCSIPMQPALWEAASLYLAFAFERVPDPFGL